MGNGFSIKTYEQYKKLTPDQKELHTFEQLSKIDFIFDKFKLLDKEYAQKRVEFILYTFIGMILIAFAGSIINNIIS